MTKPTESTPTHSCQNDWHYERESMNACPECAYSEQSSTEPPRETPQTPLPRKEDFDWSANSRAEAIARMTEWKELYGE